MSPSFKLYESQNESEMPTILNVSTLGIRTLHGACKEKHQKMVCRAARHQHHKTHNKRNLEHIIQSLALS